MRFHLACPWLAAPAALAVLTVPSAAIAVATRAAAAAPAEGSSTPTESEPLPAKHSEPTPDEAGLFGPPFTIPLLRADTGAVAAEVQMQLAVTPAEQHHGLMFRRSLGEESGMLFLYTAPRRRVLWMQNTLVPLDAAWFTGDGVMREVQQLHPLDLTYRWSQRQDIVMGLEMKQGFFAGRGFQPGELRLDLQALATALTARGFEPERFVNADIGFHQAAQSQSQL
mmetsp:Transcript_126933/g.353496  ORF Transcript_126933/g.353496 Transcript_126933/m.353496 type:complete len:225 (-) Transcript_126933:132-806(-)